MSDKITTLLKSDTEKLESIIAKYPKQIPCTVVAELLGCKPEGVRQAVAEGKLGISWKLSGKLTSGNCIPTAHFVRWYLCTSI